MPKPFSWPSLSHPLPDRFKIFGGEGGNCWPVLHSHVQMPKECPKPKCITTAPRGRESVNFVNFGICWLHFGKTEWNLRALASHRGSLRAACVQPAWPAWHRVEACVAPACNLRGLRAPAWNLRGLRGACVAPPACNLRATCVACVAPARRFSSHLRPTGVAPRGKTQKIPFLSVWNNEIVKTAENAQKNRKTIVVHTWGFCGLHRLHFVPKRLGGFAFVPQKSSSAQIQQSRGLIFHPKGPPQKRVAMAHSRFRKVENKHRRHKTPQVRCFFWFGEVSTVFWKLFFKGAALSCLSDPQTRGSDCKSGYSRRRNSDWKFLQIAVAMKRSSDAQRTDIGARTLAIKTFICCWS